MWIIAGSVVTLVIAAYVLSRTTGLPGSTDDIGNWGAPPGIATLFVGASVLALSSAVLLGRRHAYGAALVDKRFEPRNGPAWLWTVADSP